MCFGGSKKETNTPAPAPAPPAPTPEEPEIGIARKKESRENFGGKDAPDYRSNRQANLKVTPTGQIRM